MSLTLIYTLNPKSRYLSDEEKKMLREADSGGYGIMMPGQWARRLMAEIDDLKAINEELRVQLVLREPDA